MRGSRRVVFNECTTDTLQASADCHVLHMLAELYVEMLSKQLQAVRAPRRRTNFSLPEARYSSDKDLQKFFTGKRQRYAHKVHSEMQAVHLLKNSVNWDNIAKHNVVVVWEVEPQPSSSHTLWTKYRLLLCKEFNEDTDKVSQRLQDVMDKLKRLYEIFPGVFSGASKAVLKVVAPDAGVPGAGVPNAGVPGSSQQLPKVESGCDDAGTGQASVDTHVQESAETHVQESVETHVQESVETHAHASTDTHIQANVDTEKQDVNVKSPDGPKRSRKYPDGLKTSRKSPDSPSPDGPKKSDKSAVDEGTDVVQTPGGYTRSDKRTADAADEPGTVKKSRCS
jgi:hypothetical protein